LESGSGQSDGAAFADGCGRILAAGADECLACKPAPVGARVKNRQFGAVARAHLFERLSHQIAATADPALIALLADLRSLPVPETEQDEHLAGEHLGIAVPLKFRSPLGILSFISTATIFGSPADITLQELALETFFPLDELTKEALQNAAQPTPAPPHPHRRRRSSLEA